MKVSISRARFNSILVRLKVARAPAKVSPIVTFQFHTGSIKSRTSTCQSLSDCNVSIPYWFD